MEIIKDTIWAVMRELTEKKEAPTDGTPQAWLEKALTKKELRHIKVNYFRRGVLGVGVDSSAWLYQLSLKKAELLGLLRHQCREIKDIRFSIREEVCQKKKPNQKKSKP